MIAPDGTPGDLPYERMKDAQAAGFQPAVMMQSQDGKIGYIPASRTADASKAGLKLLPVGQQEAKDHPGFWAQAGSIAIKQGTGIDLSPEEFQSAAKNLGSDLWNMAKGAPKIVQNAIAPNIQEQSQQIMQQAQHFKEQGEGAHPYSLFYRLLTPLAENTTGVNVRGMEQGAKEGDAGAVLGHAAAPLVAVGATEAAGAAFPKIAEGASAVSDAAGRVADLTHEVTPKQVAQTVGVTHFTGKAFGKIVEAIVGDRANQPISPRPVQPVYPGADQPTMPSEVAQASGLGSIPQRVAPPAAQTGEALGTIPARAVPGEVAPTAQAAPAEPPPAPSPTTEPKPPSEVTLTGESALRKILTGQDNANLLKIAKSRGINVTQESQLKPGVADGKLINKIIDSHSEEELSNLRDLYMENTRFKHDFGDIGPEAWKALSMQSYFPDVKIPATVLKRMESSVRAASAAKTAAPPSDLTPLLQQSLENVKRRREASQ